MELLLLMVLFYSLPLFVEFLLLCAAYDDYSIVALSYMLGSCWVESGESSKGLKLAVCFPFDEVDFCWLKRSTVNFELYGDRSVLLKPFDAKSELTWPPLHM